MKSSRRQRAVLAVVASVVVLGNARRQAPLDAPPTDAQITVAVGSDADARGVFSTVLMDLFHDRHSTEFFLAAQMRANWFPTVAQVEFVRLTDTEAAALIATCGRYW